MATAALYTPEVLELATSLSRYPLDESLPIRGEARSRACGSTILLGLELDDAGRVAKLGLQSRACAIGQAAAAIFAGHAVGRSAAEIAAAGKALSDWLSGEGPLPKWPGIAALDRARDYTGRHDAIMLAWQAAGDILCTSGSQR